MKKFFVFSAITLSSLTTLASADEPVYPPCNGNFGITYPNRCTPQPPIPDIPDEAFAPAPDAYVPAPAPVVQQPPAPCAEPRAVAPLYQPRTGLSGLASQGKLFTNPNRVREVGVRSLSGDGYGASAYVKTKRASSRVGLEFSIDAIDSVELTQLSLIGYSRAQGIVKPYAFAGVGAYIEEPGFSAQVGAGADIALTPRISLNTDIRFLVADEAGYTYYEDCFDCFYDEDSFEGALVSVGLGYKFGALGNTGKTLFKGSSLQRAAATGFPAATIPARPSTFASLFNSGLEPWNSSRYMARWNHSNNTPAAAPAALPAKKGLLRGGAPAANTYGLTKEVGARTFVDVEYGDNDGGGLYFKTQRPNGRLGGEVSLDFFGDTVLGQGALLGYLNPKGIVKPYGLLGAGINISAEEGTVQWGAGLSADVSSRLNFSADLRGIEGGGSYSYECDESGFCYDNYNYFSTVVGSLGVGLKF